MSNVKRLNRLVEILRIMSSSKKMTVRDFQDHFGISDRTVFRDMAALQEAYFPVYLDSELGTYRFADDFSFKKIDLTKNEIRALLASRAVVSKLGAGVSTAFDNLMKKVQTDTGCKTQQRISNAAQAYWFDIDEAADFSAIQPQFEATQNAIEEKVRLEIEYVGMGDREKNVRQVDPYGLFYSCGVWYMLAYCHLRKDIREFALDCMRKFKTTDTPYALPKGFSMDKYFEGGWHIITCGEPIEVKLRFSSDVARWITRKKWHPTQKIETKKDGSIVFKVTLNGTEEIRRWIYHWGSNCEVLGPKNFRKEVAEELKAMAGVYRR